MRQTLVTALCVPAIALAACNGARLPGGTGAARFVGKELCAQCHPHEASLWEGSHHALAMQPADVRSVKGHFHEASLTHAGVTSVFSHDEDGFLVRTQGADGALHDYRVAFSFGVDPLQQYIVPFPGGRHQVLSLCWDSREAGQGGERWFHLYPGQQVAPDNPLHWTGPSQNWNSMCAECHTTHLRRAYLAEEDRFDTTWSEMGVSCEACHGPGSRHVSWAEAGAREPLLASGFEVRLAGSRDAVWSFEGGDGIARRRGPLVSGAALETCGVCHSRRIPLMDGREFGRPLADSYRVALLEDTLYWADGQILSEVYEYGSFLQSAMFRAGVTCTDCHDPHSAGKQSPDDTTCHRCHLPARFATSGHHHHRDGSPGSSCIGCHMPSRLYMVVDRRHDHSFRVPRPDLSVRLSVPNACGDCHADRPAAWAADVVAGWFPKGRAGSFHYGMALQAGRSWAPNRGPWLRRVVADASMPAIVRATALTLMAPQLEPADVPEIERSLSDSDPLVRMAAVGAHMGLPSQERASRLRPSLIDPVRAVREGAAVLLVGTAGGPPLEAAIEEYRETQRLNAERADSWVNLGSVKVREGDLKGAEQAYRQSLARMPGFVPAAVSLADLYRTQGRDAEGEIVLRESVRRHPESSEAHEALGLLLVRLRRRDEAIVEFRLAASAADAGPRFSYTLGVALNSAGRPGEAIGVLESAYERFPAYRPIPEILAMLHRDQGDVTRALLWARRYADLAPSDPEGPRLVARIRQSPDRPRR